MNYIDIIIILVMLGFLIDGYRRGFINVFFEIIEFIISIFIALKFYQPLADKIESIFSITPNLKNIIAFIILWVASEIVLSWLSYLLLTLIPSILKRNIFNKICGIFLSIIKGLFFIAVILTLILALPAFPNLKNSISNSYFGNKIVVKSANLITYFQKNFGGVVEQSLVYLTPKPEEKEIKLNFKPTVQKIDEQSELKMLQLVNAERAKIGLNPLIFSSDLQKLARAHARDMWQRGYFSHNTPEGIDPMQRAINTGIKFELIGENLALSPNVDLAHIGLMNSPGHRANILDNNFGKIGIGVIDGGKYGKIFVQEFSN